MFIKKNVHLYIHSLNSIYHKYQLLYFYLISVSIILVYIDRICCAFTLTKAMMLLYVSCRLMLIKLLY